MTLLRKTVLKFNWCWCHWKGRRGACDKHSDAFYKKVLSQNLTKLGEELCDYRNAKENLVSFWAEGVTVEGLKQSFFFSKAVFLSQNHWILMILRAAAAVWCWNKEQPG